MEFCTGRPEHVAELIDLFKVTFTASEGADEGDVIATFVRALIETTPSDDLILCWARDGSSVAGCVAFSRLSYPKDPRDVFILSPLAVRPTQQGTGIGQALINFGLDQLRASGVDVVLTYGDPSYYQKTGFLAISEEIAQPPLKLSQPQGWLGQSLTGRDLAPLNGPSQCVAALNDQNLW